MQKSQEIYTPIYKPHKNLCKFASIIDIISEVLSQLQYTSTLKTLEKQTFSFGRQTHLNTIKQKLKSYHYKAASKQIDFLNIPSSLKIEIIKNLQELQFDYWVYCGEDELLLQQLPHNTIISELKKSRIYQMIGLGMHDISLSQISSKHELILKKCQSASKDRTGIRQRVRQYINMQIPRQNVTKIDPPSRLISQYNQAPSLPSQTINFIKFNKDGKKIAILGETDQFFKLALFQIRDKDIKPLSFICKKSIEYIIQLKWSELQTQIQYLAVCSYKIIYVFNANKLQINFTINSQILSVSNFLCFQWHPISQFLFVGGTFNKILVFNRQGIFQTQINPYCKIRQMVFSPQGNLYTIGATKEGQLLKYCLNQNKIINKFISQSILMSLKYQNNILIATNQHLVFIIDPKTMIQLYHISIEPNRDKFIVEAFIFNSWVLVFNSKLVGFRKSHKSFRKLYWPKCKAIDVKQNKMITFSTQSSIQLWGENSNQQQLIEQNQSDSASERVSSSSVDSSSQPPSSDSSEVVANEFDLQIDSNNISEGVFEQMIEIDISKLQSLI